MPVLNTLIHQLPIKIANNFVAHFILKTSMANASSPLSMTMTSTLSIRRSLLYHLAVILSGGEGYVVGYYACIHDWR